jgi:hypothetical protein
MCSSSGGYLSTLLLDLLSPCSVSPAAGSAAPAGSCHSAWFGTGAMLAHGRLYLQARCCARFSCHGGHFFAQLLDLLLLLLLPTAHRCATVL